MVVSKRSPINPRDKTDGIQKQTGGVTNDVHVVCSYINRNDREYYGTNSVVINCCGSLVSEKLDVCVSLLSPLEYYSIQRTIMTLQ